MKKAAAGDLRSLAAGFLAVLFVCFPVALAEESVEEALAYFKRGQDFLRKMEYDKALREYKRAVQIEPKNEALFKAIADLCERFGDREEKWRQLAAFYRNTGEYEKALSFYGRILSVRRDDTEVLNAVGNIHGFRGEYGKALDYYERSLKLRESADAFVGKGDVYFFQNLLGKAEEEYRKALELEPAHPAAHRRLGQVHEKRGDYGKALEEYQSVLKGKWNDTEILVKVGWMHEAHQDPERAQTCYARAAELDPENPDALNGLGRVSVALGRHADAERCFQEALRRSGGPRSVEALNGMGWLHAWQGRHAEARRYFYRAMGVDELNLEAKTGLGWIYSRRGEYGKAAEWYQQAREEAGRDLSAAGSIGMAWVYTREEKYDEAIKSYKNVLEKSPKSIEAYNGLGLLCLQRGDPDAARRFYSKSLDIAERNPDAHYGIAQVFESGRRLEEAIGHYKKAVAYNPLNLQYRKALAMCYVKSADYEKALGVFEGLAAAGIRDEEIWDKLGSLNMEMGRLDEAEEWFGRISSEMDPKSLSALAGLGEVHFARGDYDRAARTYQRALRVDPNSRVARRGLARVYQRRGLHDRAAAEFWRMISSKYNDVESWNSLGWLYRQSQDYDKSLECYLKGFSFIEDNPDGLVGLSYLYLDRIRGASSREEREGYFREALRSCQKVLAQEPRYLDAFLCMSDLYLEMGDSSGAERVLADASKVFQEVADAEPDNWMALEEELRVKRKLLLVRCGAEGVKGVKKEEVNELVGGYKRLLERKIDDQETWLNLASLYTVLKYAYPISSPDMVE